MLEKNHYNQPQIDFETKQGSGGRIGHWVSVWAVLGGQNLGLKSPHTVKHMMERWFERFGISR